MPKFTGPSNTPQRRGIIQTTATQVPTFEGGQGYARTARSELFLQAVSEMAEDTYYESAEQRRVRLSFTIAEVLKEKDGWAWVCNLVSWLRNEGNMRSASIMIAAEAVAAKGTEQGNLPGPTSRQLISSAILRADEPAEMLGYWLEYHGRQIPASVKRGIADSAVRLYTERSALKYDGQSRAIRMADVIDLTHPSPSGDQQSALFRHLLDRRHNREDLNLSALPLFATDFKLQHLDESERMGYLPEAIESGWQWERLAGWLPGGMNAHAWESVIPNMGYMALLRNLRNFDQAGISDSAKKFVTEKLADPEEVAKSRQFPYRFLSAHKAIESLTWGAALETAMQHSIQNVPEFEGRTLVLIDTSGSMQSSVAGARSLAQRWEVAALFGAALAVRNPGRTDVAIYASYDKQIKAPTSGASVLRFVKEMNSLIGVVGHGTNTWSAIANQYSGQDRVVVLTDEQSHDRGTNPGAWLHFVNLAGYQAGTASPDPKTFAYGGFTDAMFKVLPLMEKGVAGRWPWQ